VLADPVTLTRHEPLVGVPEREVRPRRLHGLLALVQRLQGRDLLRLREAGEADALHRREVGLLRPALGELVLALVDLGRQLRVRRDGLVRRLLGALGLRDLRALAAAARGLVTDDVAEYFDVIFFGQGVYNSFSMA